MKGGLTAEEWQKIRDKNLVFLQDVATTIAPFGCLTSNAAAHLRKDWLTYRDSHIRIDIPPKAPCNSYKILGDNKKTTLPPLKERDSPCNYCIEEGETDGFENLWFDLQQNTSPTQTAFLNRDLAKPAIDVIKLVFDKYGRPEIAATPRGIRESALRLREYNCVSNFEDYSSLLRTGPVLYCHYGLDKEEISRATRYSVESIGKIVAATPGHTFDQITTTTLLRLVSEMEPVSAGALADRLDYYDNAVRKRLNRLKNRGRVRVSNNHPGSPPATWRTTEDWQSPFRCDECGFKTSSLGSISVHEGKAH